MVRFFSQFNNLALIVLFFGAVILRLCIFFSIPEQQLQWAYDFDGPFTYHLFQAFSYLGLIPKWGHFILGTLIVYLQAVQMNTIFYQHKIFKDATFLPSLTYMISASLIPEFLVLSGPLLATTFLIAAIQIQYASFKLEKAFSNAFWTGVLLSIASMFYVPYALFFLFAFVSWTAIRPFIWREYAIIVLGYLFPIYTLITFGYFFGQLGAQWQLITEALRFGSPKIFIDWNPVMIALVSIFSLLGIIGAWKLQKHLLKSAIQTRIYIRQLNYLVVVPIIGLFLGSSLGVDHFFAVSISWTPFMVEILKGFKRQYIAEIIHLLLWLLILGNQYQTNFLG